MNLAAKYSHAFHLHHVLEREKKHNPSHGIDKTMEEQRFENCKTIMLCAGCHYIITYNEGEKKLLMNKFAELGY